jgi:hypothetical protein
MQAQTNTDQVLTDYANKISEYHSSVIKNDLLCITHGTQTINCAIKAGELLIEAKKLLKHGEWLNWLQYNTNISDETARKYRLLAEHQEQLKDITTLREAYIAVEAVTTDKTEPDTTTATKKAATKPNDKEDIVPKVVGVNYLRNAFNAGNFTVDDTIECVIYWIDRVEHVESLKPIVAFYNEYMQLRKNEPLLKDATNKNQPTAIEVIKQVPASPEPKREALSKPMFAFQPAIAA